MLCCVLLICLVLYEQRMSWGSHVSITMLCNAMPSSQNKNQKDQLRHSYETDKLEWTAQFQLWQQEKTQLTQLLKEAIQARQYFEWKSTVLQEKLGACTCSMNVWLLHERYQNFFDLYLHL
jgi:hypothetical protein